MRGHHRCDCRADYQHDVDRNSDCLWFKLGLVYNALQATHSRMDKVKMTKIEINKRIYYKTVRPSRWSRDPEPTHYLVHCNMMIPGEARVFPLKVLKVSEAQQIVRELRIKAYAIREQLVA